MLRKLVLNKNFSVLIDITYMDIKVLDLIKTKINYCKQNITKTTHRPEETALFKLPFKLGMVM